MAAQVPPPKANTNANAPTTAERARRFLLYGFALSLLLHIIIAPFLTIKTPEPDPEKVTVIKRDRMPTPPPTPKPTPKPTPTPPPTPPPKQTPPPKHTPEPTKPKLKINTQKTTAHNGQSSEAANTHTEGSVNGVPNGTSTAAAAAPVQASTNPPAPPPPPPTPTPPACKVPNAVPRTIEAAEVDTPAIAQQQGITGEVQVLISLDANSKMVGTPTIQKSPSAVLNKAAIDAAKNSKFQTEIKDCVPLAAKYIFVVEFQSQ